MGERWATFDCYGTLIDWEGGIRAAVSELWPDADPQRLLEHYHAVEPRVQADRDLPYREVMARALAAIAATDALEVPAGRADSLGESLPSWRPFAEVPDSLREARKRGWRLAALSNTDPDLLAASIEALGVPFDLTITAAEAGSYKPAPGHWEAFRARTGEIDAHVHVAARCGCRRSGSTGWTSAATFLVRPSCPTCAGWRTRSSKPRSDKRERTSLAPSPAEGLTDVRASSIRAAVLRLNAGSGSRRGNGRESDITDDFPALFDLRLDKSPRM